MDLSAQLCRLDRRWDRRPPRHHREAGLPPAAAGVDVVWLSPIYTSPQDDDGYDISDYRNVDPLFGTLKELRELSDQAERARHREAGDGPGRRPAPRTSTRRSWNPGPRRRARTQTRTGGGRRGTSTPRGPPLGARRRSRPRLGLGVLRARVGVRPGHRGVLPARLFEEAAGPELGEYRGPRGGLRDDELVAGPGRGRVPDGTSSTSSPRTPRSRTARSPEGKDFFW